MHTRNASDVTPHYLYPESYSRRIIEAFMHQTYLHPRRMVNMVYGFGITSAATLLTPWILLELGISDSLTPWAMGLGAVGLLTTCATAFMQQRVFGLPLSRLDKELFFHPHKYAYKTGEADITYAPNGMAKLSIKADTAFDAGYVEGYILARNIKDNLEKSNFLYPAMRLFLGAPGNDEDLNKKLKKIWQTIPVAYLEEMQGKVQGYNDWLAEHNDKKNRLSLDRYLVLQLLPDLKNYNPFTADKSSCEMFSDWDLVAYGCTTIALRLGDYTSIVRVLDWPAHNVAGKSFLQIERQIGNVPKTIDIGLPLLSGAATVLNEKGLLIEINISPGGAVKEPGGMPSFFFNRYCAEHASNVKDIEYIIKDKQPAGAYHLTATDGCDTQSFHFYQDKQNPGRHVIESLEMDKQEPQLMVVANNAVAFKNNKPVDINYCDSNQRKSNIHQFFKHHNKQGIIPSCMHNQKDGELSKENIRDLKELLVQAARLPLVNNCESVLCAMYIYHGRKLIDATVATDNMYAQNQEPSAFRRLDF